MASLIYSAIVENLDNQESILEKVRKLREAIVQKIPEFYEMFSQTGGGSIGFLISYSEMVISAKLVGKSE